MTPLERSVDAEVGRLGRATFQGMVRTPRALANQARTLSLKAQSKLSSLSETIGWRALSFSSVDEMRSSRQGAPVYVYYVPRDGLVRYKPGSNVSALIPAQPTEWIVPLLNDRGEVKSSVFYSRDDDSSWDFQGAGMSERLRDMVAIRSAFARATLAPDDAFFSVRALDQTFLAFRKQLSGVLFLIPVVDDPALLTRGSVRPVEEVFGKFAGLARDRTRVP